MIQLHKSQVPEKIRRLFDPKIWHVNCPQYSTYKNFCVEHGVLCQLSTVTKLDNNCYKATWICLKHKDVLYQMSPKGLSYSQLLKKYIEA